MTKTVSIDQFRAELDEFRRQYLKPIGIKLEISPPYDLIEDWKKDNAWPEGDKAGVYAIFEKDETLLYIGKASTNSWIGKRLSFYFPGTAAEPMRIPADHNWKDQDGVERKPHLVVTAALPKGKEWMAPAIEEYLIGKLEPMLNTVGRKRPK